MRHDTLKRAWDLVEEMERDLSDKEVKKNNSPRLLLIDTSHMIEEEKPSSSSPSDDREEASEQLSEGTLLYSDSRSGGEYSLSIYFKNISKYPLLSESEEKNLAQRIKEREHACKNQIITWRMLLKDSLLTHTSSKQLRVITEKMYRIDETFRILDKVIIWEQEREKINDALTQRAQRAHTTQELQEQLYKAETGIAKCIAEIHLSKKTVSRVVVNLKKIAESTMKTKKQHTDEGSLKKTLSEISHHAREVRVLKTQLIQANLRLVISIAKRYVNRGLGLSDLIQEGNLGLIRAIDTYDYRRGHRFITYATWWIKQAMIRAHDYQSRTIRTPVYINEKLHQIEKATNRLLQKSNREPTLEEIAAESNISLGIVERVLHNCKDVAVVDAATDEGNEKLFNTALPHTLPSTSDHVVSRELAHTIDRILSHLTPRERKIIKLRFGIGEKYDHTLEQIGVKFNISRERIRQLLEVSLDELRKPEHIEKLKDFIEMN